MKKYLFTSLLFVLSALVANGKNVKTFNIEYTDGANKLSELISEEEKYSVDSICISGYFDETNFAFLRDCTINGNLRGIDMSGAEVYEIPSLLFGNTQANSPARDASVAGNLSKLQYIRLPQTLQRIGYRAFSNSDLRSITIPKVYEIKAEAFSHCVNLREVTMNSYNPPRTEVGSAFINISSDAVLNVPTGALAAYSSSAAYSDFREIREQTGLYNIRGYYVEGKPLQDLMGADMLNVDSVSIGGRLTADDIQTLSDNVTKGRLSGIDLTNCVLPDNEVPEAAFANSSSSGAWQVHLNYIKLPQGVTRLGIDAFSGSFFYALNMPSTVRSIGRCCFENATVNGDFVVPEGVEKIEKLALNGMTVTGDVYLPSTLNKVENKCLAIDLGSDDRNKPRGFYCNRMTPPDYVSDDVAGYGKLFSNNLPSATNWTLYVPKGAKEAFAANRTWGQFPNIVETPKLDGGTSGINNTLAVGGQNVEERIYTIDGRYVGTDMSNLGKGVYVVNGKKVVK